MNKLPSIAANLSHNAAISVLKDDEIECVIEIERFINQKNASFEFFEPTFCKDFILQSAQNYLEKEFGFKNYEKFIINDGFNEFPKKYKQIIKANEYVLDKTHHELHAYNSLYQSNHNKSLIISFDGGGCDGYFCVFIGEKGKDLQKLKTIYLDLGSNYHVFGSFCEEIKNYHVLTAAGKVLGLQSYGKVVDEWKLPIEKFFRGCPYWENYDQRIKTMSDEIGISFSKDQKISGRTSYDLTRTAQDVFENLFFESVDDCVGQYNELPIIITGGCALNINLNTIVLKKYKREVFVAPNSSDCGNAVGLLCKYLKPKKIIDVTYKGIDILDKNTLIELVNIRKGRLLETKNNIVDDKFKLISIDEIAQNLANNKIIGIVQGRSEHGPRALGNRSIICSPLSPNMKDTLNAKVKHREWFRPFAPIVRLEDVSEYFEWEGESRWMNFCVKVKQEFAEKLLAVTHIDKSARIQTITKNQNEFLYNLLTCFKEKTGVGVLVNTSFNVDGKPILSTYKDAIKVFDETQLDCLYLDGFYFSK
jgi:carbamoyltransferase